ncbi:MAG: DegT/DnrJ/EryC1/StrS family aminotransferase [bacterium]|nr:DegT/DnrJ/EryC1/StrS family aminotransferase [bacterium]
MRKKILAINGGKPVRKKPFPSWPIHDHREKKAVLEVLETGKWFFRGKVEEFEQKFAQYQDAKFGITTVNGTVALEVALACSGIGVGDEVILPPYTFIATATAVIRVGAIPVFVDITPDTLTINPEKIEKAITKKTKAIIPVHVAGHPADLDRIKKIAKKHNLIIIEDACHAWGTEWRGKKVGATGNLGCFSFQYGKNMTAGEGGIILTNNSRLAELCWSYRHCGRKKGKPWYEHYIFGGNYRLTEFQAAILLAQLTRLDKQTTLRQKNASYLDKKFSQIDGIEPLPLHKDARVTRRSYHMYMFRYNAKDFCGVSKKRFIRALIAEGIPCSPGYSIMYKNPCFLNKKSPIKSYLFSNFCENIDYAKVRCPETEKAAKEVIWFSQNMLLGTKKDMDDICKTIIKIKENIGELG